MMLRHSRWSGRHIMPTGPGWMARDQAGGVAACLTWSDAANDGSKHSTHRHLAHLAANDAKPTQHQTQTSATTTHQPADEPSRGDTNNQSDDASSIVVRRTAQCCCHGNCRTGESCGGARGDHPRRLHFNERLTADGRHETTTTTSSSSSGDAHHRQRPRSSRRPSRVVYPRTSAKSNTVSTSCWDDVTDSRQTNENSSDCQSRPTTNDDVIVRCDLNRVSGSSRRNESRVAEEERNKTGTWRRQAQHVKDVTNTTNDRGTTAFKFATNGVPSKQSTSHPSGNDSHPVARRSEKPPLPQQSTSSATDKLTAQLAAALSDFKDKHVPHLEDDVIDALHKYLRVHDQQLRSKSNATSLSRQNSRHSTVVVRPSTASTPRERVPARAGDVRRRSQLSGRRQTTSNSSDFQRQRLVEFRQGDVGPLSDLIVIRAATPQPAEQRKQHRGVSERPSTSALNGLTTEKWQSTVSRDGVANANSCNTAVTDGIDNTLHRGNALNLEVP